MAGRKKFFDSWKSTFTILPASFYSIILIVVEELIESEFQCPQRKDLRIVYGLSFFIFPSFILLLLTLTLQQDSVGCACCSEKHSWDQHCETVGKAVGFSFLWCVILLIDGRYTECINTAFKNSSEPTVQTSAQPSSEAYIISQICVVIALFVIICVYCLYTLFPFWFRCANKEVWKEIERQRILEEETQVCISKEEMYVQEIVKNILVSKFQERLKNVSNNISVKGIFEEVKKFLNPSATSDMELGNLLPAS